MAESGGFVFLKLAGVAWAVVWTLGFSHRRKSPLQILTSRGSDCMKLGGLQLSPRRRQYSQQNVSVSFMSVLSYQLSPSPPKNASSNFSHLKKKKKP